MHFYEIYKVLYISYISYVLYKKVPYNASFTAKFEFVFVLTQENDFSERFHFKLNRKSISSSKNRYQGF